MTKIEFFSPPDGTFVVNPRLDWLADLLLNKGEDYWNAGAGQASLKREGEGGGPTKLLLTMASALRFYLEYIDANRVYFVSIGEGTFDETVAVYVGGDPLVLPTAFLISKELALTAVEEFCKTGERSKNVKWRRRREVNWHYGLPEE